MQPNPPSSVAKPKRPNRGLILGIVAVVIVALIVVAFVLMLQAKATGTVRDVFIILMAIVMLFIGVMMAALVYQLAALTRMLREEIKPLLENAEETVNTARGTTLFVSEHMLRPVINAAGTVAGVARVLSLLGELRRPRRMR